MDLIGELYYINLSCLGAESGCMFFKVLGTNNITDGRVLSTGGGGGGGGGGGRG